MNRNVIAMFLTEAFTFWKLSSAALTFETNVSTDTFS